LAARSSAAQVPRQNGEFLDFMRETVEMIVKALVDEADAVDVREIERDGTTRIEVRVARGDMGKVIGKQGRTVRALRSLVYAAGLKKHRRFVLDVVE
jgi:predicted RNA-binding protein YlqC (UPF0109 family)